MIAMYVATYVCSQLYMCTKYNNVHNYNVSLLLTQTPGFVLSTSGVVMIRVPYSHHEYILTK